MAMQIFLGTYTRRGSEGIYTINLDREKKEMKALTLRAKIADPTYLDVRSDKNLIFTVVRQGDQGGIASLVRDEDKNYRCHSMVLAEGPPPVYLKYDPLRNFIYTSNYHKGELSLYRTDQQGNLELSDTITHSGSSVHKNQKSSHVHYSDLTPDKKYLIACDLGTDEVYTYQVKASGKLNEKSRIKFTPASGPRHLVFHPLLEKAYVIAELASEIIVLDYHQQTGKFKEKQRLSTIPQSHKSFNSGAAIRISKDGRFLYASNRGHDSLVIYAIKNQGELSLVDYQKTEGHTPRDFNLDPSDQFVVVGHQDSDNLTLFERNPDNGRLDLRQKDFYAPEVVNIWLS